MIGRFVADSATPVTRLFPTKVNISFESNLSDEASTVKVRVSACDATVACFAVVIASNVASVPDEAPSITSSLVKLPITLLTWRDVPLKEVTTIAVDATVVAKNVPCERDPLSVVLNLSLPLKVPVTPLTTSSVLLVRDTTTAVGGVVVATSSHCAPEMDPVMTRSPAPCGSAGEAGTNVPVTPMTNTSMELGTEMTSAVAPLLSTKAVPDRVPYTFVGYP
jgi:hypothetical protein